MTDRIYLSIGERKIAGFITLCPNSAADVEWQAGAPLPFPDDSVDAIVHEGFVQTLETAQLLPFMAECRRVLKADGIMRVACADVVEQISRYGDHSDATVFDTPDGERTHQFDESRLVQLLERAGFADSIRRPRGDSPHEHLANLEVRATSSLVLEARKLSRRRKPQPPKVSVIITGSEPGDAIHNVLGQGYSDLEVIVLGQTDDGRVTRADSLVHAFDVAAGDFVKVLHPSVRLEARCIEKQAAVLHREQNASLVASHRRHVGPESKPLKDTQETRRIVGEPSIIPGLSAVQALLQRELDFIGSPSGAMFRRRDLETAVIPLLENGNHIQAWIALLLRGDLAYLPESLSTAPRIAAPDEQQWEHARQTAFEAGLWHPNGPSGIWPRPMFPLPWWQERTIEAVKNVLQCLERGDPQSAREAIVARADEDAFDPVVALLEAELGASEFGTEHTIERVTTLLRGHEWYVPAQMRLIRLLRGSGGSSVSDEILAALHAMVPIVEFGDGIEQDNGRWYVHPASTLHQIGGCVELELSIGLRRPECYAERSIVVRAAVDSEFIGEWTWEPGTGIDETLCLQIPPTRRAQSILIEWDVVSAPFEGLVREPLELTEFEVSLAREPAERASA